MKNKVVKHEVVEFVEKKGDVSMKKKFLKYGVITCALFIASSFYCEIVDELDVFAKGYTYNYDTSKLITADTAKQIALDKVSFTAADVNFTKCKLEFDNGVWQYEVEFYNGFDEYEFDINAENSSIMKYDFDINNKVSNTNVVNNMDTSNLITEEAAKQIALDNVSFTAADVNFTKCKLDFDDGVWQYEVEFYNGLDEYEFEINATTSEIMQYDFDYALKSSALTLDTSNLIISDVAKQIALDSVSFTAADVNFTKCKLDFDDGVWQYEVEFYNGFDEYEFEINAATSEIMKYDFDFATTNTAMPTINNTVVRNEVTPVTLNNQANADFIGDSRAKEIALSDASINASDVSFIKCEFDYDDGIYEYEVEWNIGRTEYEYKINALTGSIMKREIDRD